MRNRTGWIFSLAGVVIFSGHARLRAQDEEPGPGAGRIDGGVFGFVQGTDPEAILLLEAVHPDGRPRWQYAFARATSAGLEARLDKPVVWAVDFLDGGTSPREPQMWLSRPRGKTASGR
jgi:hypothetical protein